MTVSDRPDLLKKWAPANAYFGLRPETTSLGSRKVVWWIDSEGNFFRRSVCDLAREASPVSVSGGSGGPQEGVCKVAASALSPQDVDPEDSGEPPRKVRQITTPTSPPQGVDPAVLSQKKASPLPVPNSVINSYIYPYWDKGRNDKARRFAAEIPTGSELFAYWNFGGETKIRRVCDVFICGVSALTN